MANFYSNQYQSAFVTEPKGKLAPAELNGRVRRIFADVTLGAEITTADSLFVAKLPSNAVVMQAHVVAPGGTGGTLALGWAAGLNEVADADGLVAGIAGNAAVNEKRDLSASEAFASKRFSEDVDLILSASVDSVGWTGDLVKVEILYVID